MSDQIPEKQTTVRKRQPGRPISRGQTTPITETILELALVEFGQHGFEGTNIGDIAVKAAVAKPLVHYHFETKEKLWQAAVSHAMDKLAFEFRNFNFELRDLDTISALSVIIRRFTYFSAKNHAVTNIVVQEMTRGTERSKWLSETYLKPLFLIAESFLQAATAKGQLREVHPGHLLSMLCGAVNGYFAFADMLADLYGIDPLSEESTREHAEMVVEIISHGMLKR